MPYTTDYMGVYKIVNTAASVCYVGQSQRVRKRIREHFRLLRKGCHPNPHLQNAYRKYGGKAFSWSLEVLCEDAQELDALEEAFITGDAYFDEPVVYNIANFAKAPMRGKTHDQAARARISKGRREASFDYKSDVYKEEQRQRLMQAHLARPDFAAKVRFIINNPQMSYAERGRALGIDTSSARKIAIKYNHLRGVL